MATRIQYSRLGGPEVLEVAEFEIPRPGPGEVVVEVRAAGLNPIEWKVRQGIRPSPPLTGPRGLGSDAAGVIAAVHPDAQDWMVGDEVIVTGASAAYATHLVAAVDRLTRKPESVDWVRAAALGVPVGTAYQALRSLGVTAATTLLVHAGAGSVGQAAIQFARLDGATVIATASPERHERLRALGAVPIAYGTGLVERVREAAPAGVDVALDAAGTDEALEASLSLVPDRNAIGTVVAGARAAELGIRAWAGGNAVPLTAEELRLRAEGLTAALDLVAEGRFDVEIAGTFPLEQAAEAQRLSQLGHPHGKIVLLP